MMYQFLRIYHGNQTHILLLNNSKTQYPKIVFSFLYNHSLQQDTVIT